MADEAVAALTTIFAQTLSPQPVCPRLAAHSNWNACRTLDRAHAQLDTACEDASDAACHLPVQVQIKQAEQQLAQLASQPNYGIAVLRVRTCVNARPPP